MADPQQGQAIDTLFIDLAVRTEAMQRDVEQTLLRLKQQMETGVRQPAEAVERQFVSMGRVGVESFKSMLITLGQTRNPFAALSSGVMTANAGLQVAAASGNTAAASLAGLAGKAVGLIAALTAIVAIGGPVVSFLKQMSEQGLQVAARVDALRVGLEVIAKNAGQNIDFVNKKVRELQITGITTRESIESVMQFLTQNLPIDNIEKLARAGQDMAVAFGVNSTETFSRFIYAIVTGNAEVLRMVGIQKTANQMQIEYAATLGKTVEQLTPLQLRQAIINGILIEAVAYAGLYEKSMESVGKQLTSLARYTEDAGLAFGTVLLPIMEGTVKVSTALMKEFLALFVVVEDGAAVIRNGKPVFTDLGQDIFDIATKVKDVIIQLVGLIDLLPVAGEKLTNAAIAASTLAGSLLNIASATVEVATAPAGVTNTTDRFLTFMGKGVTAFAQIVVGVLALLVTGWTFFGEIVENVARRIRGELQLTVEELKKIALEAGRRFVESAGQLTGTLPTPKQYVERTKDDEAFPGYRPLKGDEGDATQQAATLQQIGLALANAIEAGRNAIDLAGQRFFEQLDKFNRSVGDAQLALGNQVIDAIKQLIKEADKMRAQLAEELAKRMQEIGEQQREVTANEEKRFQEQQLRAKEDYLFQMQRLEEDYTLNLMDAVQNRDARQVLLLMRQYGIDKRRAEEDFNRRRMVETKDHEKRMEEINERAEEERRRLQEAYNERLADIDKALAERATAYGVYYREQMLLLVENAEKQRTEMWSQYFKQIEDMKTANAIRLREMVLNWADQGTITEEGARKVLDALDDVYGEDGKISVLITDFLERQKRNARIKITIETEEIENPPLDYPPRGKRATGGLFTATRATNVTFGEAGEETALFMPKNTNIGLAQLANLFGGRTSASELSVTVDVKADQRYSREFEDRLMGVIADVVVESIPGTKVRSR